MTDFFRACSSPFNQVRLHHQWRQFFLRPFNQHAGITQLFGCACLCLLVCATSLAGAQTSAPINNAPSAQGAAKGIASTAPAPWAKLHPEQKDALAPLAKIWDTLPSVQQLKWLTLAANFSKMASLDQTRLQSRMHEWASLGMRERDQARIGFSETRQLSDQQKKAKWEAYQALSPQEKQALAQQNQPKKGLAAKPTSPIPVDKKVNMPTTPALAASSAASVPLVGVIEKRKPKLAAVPEKVSPHTLLPTDKH